MCGDVNSSPRSTAMMLPHDGVGASTPTPRIARAPSATMATATPSSAIENIAGSDVREHLADHDAAVLGALGPGGEDELALGPAERARTRDPADERDRDDPIAMMRISTSGERGAAELCAGALEERDERQGEARWPGRTACMLNVAVRNGRSGRRSSRR